MSSDIAVATIAKTSNDEWRSAPLPISYTSARPALEYTLAIKKSLFKGATVTATIEPRGFSGALDVTLVVASGALMPATARSGDVIARQTLELDADGTVVLQAPIPRVPFPYLGAPVRGGHGASVLPGPTHLPDERSSHGAVRARKSLPILLQPDLPQQSLPSGALARPRPDASPARHAPTRCASSSWATARRRCPSSARRASRCWARTAQPALTAVPAPACAAARTATRSFTVVDE